jgi:hypothetical protein
VTLKRRDEQRNERLEPFPADPVGGLPQQDERLTHGLVIDWQTRTPARPAGDRRCPEQSDDVLAVVARHRDKFIEDTEFLFLQAASIPLSNRLQQILPGFCAELVCHGVLLGSATLVADFVRQRPPWVTERVSQCVRQISLSPRTVRGRGGPRSSDPRESTTIRRTSSVATRPRLPTPVANVSLESAPIVHAISLS